MNDARRQLLHESFKLIDLLIMIGAFVLAVWASSSPTDPLVPLSETYPARSLPVAETATDSTPPVGTAVGDSVLSAVGPLDMAGALAVDANAGADAALTGGRRSAGDARSWWASAEDLLHRVEDVLHAINPWLTPEHVGIVFTTLLFWYTLFNARGLYNSRRLESSLAETRDVVRAGFFASLAVWAIASTAVAPILSDLMRVELDFLRFGIYFALLAIGSTIVVRLFIRHLLTKARLRGRNLRAVLVVGTNHRAIRFATSIEAKPELGYYVVGFVDEEWDGIAGFKKAGGRLVSNLKDLGVYMANNVVDEVVVALPVSSAYIYSSRIVSLCQEQGITVRFVSQIFDSRLARGRLDVFEEEPMLSLESVTEERFGKVAKAMLDRFVAASMLIGLVPLFVVVGLLIKVTSKGPVFFVQNRIGLNKRPFPLFKFRTMVVDAEERLKEIEHLNEVSGPVFKIEKDPRVTPLGEFLRKSSIDELPQLWNVLRGDMSLVGPRPLPERDYAGFDTDSHRRRLSVRPGLTCTWQVSGRNSIPFERWMEMDLEYIDGWSFWLDLKILLQTIPVVLGPLFFFRKGEFVKGKNAAVAESGQGG
ncbi:MAG: sugar transferase [Acidobacteriota bacterium]